MYKSIGYRHFYRDKAVESTNAHVAGSKRQAGKREVPESSVVFSVFIVTKLKLSSNLIVSPLLVI